MEAHIETATYNIIDPYGEVDKIYVGDTLTWSKYPQNVVVFLSDEARTITPTYTQSGVTLQYSIDGGSNWVTVASKTATESSKEIWFRGQATGFKSLYSSSNTSNAWAFSSPHTSLRVKGNLNHLLCDTLGDTGAPLAAAQYCYSHMFNGCTSLVEIKLGYTGKTFSNLSGWVTSITTVGALYKAGEQFDASGDSTYPATWTQIPWTP